MAATVKAIKVMQRKNENGRKQLVDAGRIIEVSPKLSRKNIGAQGYVLLSDWNEGNIHNIKDYGRQLNEIQFNPGAEKMKDDVISLVSENEALKKQLAELQAKAVKTVESEEKEPVVIAPDANISAVEAELQERIEGEQTEKKTRKPRAKKED